MRSCPKLINCIKDARWEQKRNELGAGVLNRFAFAFNEPRWSMRHFGKPILFHWFTHSLPNSSPLQNVVISYAVHFLSVWSTWNCFLFSSMEFYNVTVSYHWGLSCRLNRGLLSGFTVLFKKNRCTKWLIYFSLYDHDLYYIWWLLKEPFVLKPRRTV